MHNRAPQHIAHEYHKIIEQAYDCCRKDINPFWVIEPDDVSEGLFKGILFGTKNSPVPGCAYEFTLFMDPAKLSEQPEIIFQRDLSFHPCFFKTNFSSNTSGSNFCFPIPCTCRDKLNVILNNLWKYFFMEKVKPNSIFISYPVKFNLSNENLINKTETESFILQNGYAQFWEKLRSLGNLGIPTEDPPKSET